MLSEKDALNAFAEMYSSGDHHDFVKMLSIDFQYTSQWVFDSMESRYAYEKYIREKLPNVQQAGDTFVARIGHWGKRPCMVLTQKSEELRQDVSVLATVLGGMVTSVTMCMVPRPEDVKPSHKQ